MKMKFKVGAKIIVKDVRYGGNFDIGDIVTIEEIGCEDDPNCYGAISPYDGMIWYLYEDEVGPITNADRIRAMSDEELATWLEYEGGGACAEVYGWLEWLQRPAEEG